MVFIFTLGFIFGTVLGSGTQVLADRSLGKKSFWGRSYCPRCKTTLAWYDLFPIFSYLFLRGKCRYCHKKIPLEYPLIEVLTGLIIGLLFVHQIPINFYEFDVFKLILVFGELIFQAFFITILVAITITDLKKTLIPDRIILPSLVVSLVFLTLFSLYKIWYLYIYLSGTPIGRLLLPPHDDYFRRHALTTLEPLLGGIVSAILISGFYILLIIITKGRGMGGGDVKLGAFMGLNLGLTGGILATILGFVSGAVISIFLIIFGKKHFGQSIPFGPFLVLGSLITLFWGPQIFEWYLQFS